MDRIGTATIHAKATVLRLAAWAARIVQDEVVRHIVSGTVSTPYVSITTSYAQALANALVPVAPNRKGCVYEIEIPDDEIGSPIPIYDPLRCIISSIGSNAMPGSLNHNANAALVVAVVQNQ